jgi:hypothetical protein
VAAYSCSRTSGFNTTRDAPAGARNPHDLLQSSRMRGKTPYAVKYGGALRRRPTSRQRHRPGCRGAAMGSVILPNGLHQPQRTTFGLELARR